MTPPQPTPAEVATDETIDCLEEMICAWEKTGGTHYLSDTKTLHLVIARIRQMQETIREMTPTAEELRWAHACKSGNWATSYDLGVGVLRISEAALAAAGRKGETPQMEGNDLLDSSDTLTRL